MLAGLAVLPGCGGGDDDGNQPPLQLVVPRDTDAGAAQRPQVTLTVTNGAGVDGTVIITLVPEYAPQTVANFLTYVNEGFYDNTIFHRVIDGDDSFHSPGGPSSVSPLAPLIRSAYLRPGVTQLRQAESADMEFGTVELQQ